MSYQHELVDRDPQLTKDDLNALRKCDSLSFFYESSLSYVRAERRDRILDGFKTDGGERHIPTLFSGDWFSPDRSRLQGKPTKCVAVVHADFGYEARQWQTISKLLRIGDTLRAYWIGNNVGRDTLVDAGISHDELWLEILRNPTHPVPRFTFLLKTWVGKVDAPDKMVAK